MHGFRLDDTARGVEDGSRAGRANGDLADQVRRRRGCCTTCSIAPSRSMARLASARTRHWRAGTARRARRVSTMGLTRSIAWSWRGRSSRISPPHGPRNPSSSPSEERPRVLETIPVRADEQFAIEPVAKLLEIDPRALRGRAVSGRSVESDLLAARGRLGSGLEASAARAGRSSRARHAARGWDSRPAAPVYPLAPRPLLVCEDSALIGAPFYVMERRHGVVLDQELPDGLAGQPRAARGDHGVTGARTGRPARGRLARGRAGRDRTTRRLPAAPGGGLARALLARPHL